MLHTHILDTTRAACKSFAVDILKFEALKNVNTCRDITTFAYNTFDYSDGSHLLERHVGELWKIYDSTRPEFKWIHPECEMHERKRFMKKPTYVAMLENKVVGGAWIDPDKREGTIHVVTTQNYRGKGIASAVLGVLERDAKSHFSILRSAWSNRESNPAPLFRKHDYRVEVNGLNGTATKTL